MWVTWKHEQSDFNVPLTYEEKVDIFYEQTLGWQLHIADLIANGGVTLGEFKRGEAGYKVKAIRHSGFAVLHVCLSYIELVGSLQSPVAKSSTKTFRDGVRVIPGLIDAAAATNAVVARLYAGARCGLYHEGRTRPGVGLGHPPDGNAIAVQPTTGTIAISPELLPVVLKTHLETLKSELLKQANVALCKRFEQRFNSGFSPEAAPRSRWRRLLIRIWRPASA
jgi:hypothetical protein